MSENTSIRLIKSLDNIYDFDEVRHMSSKYELELISKNKLIKFLSGEILLDLTDEEYIHVMKLDSDALEYVKNNISINY
ncbi:hypothetical protein FEFB_10990 [Fructobacillus sp. EFB-N1]|uniref:hypothetical protein n=1 Tax=Fructobacillus sp. EFB-N1 TaxID=1658766 RepID=UPI00064D9AEB|nr:hypothetical protein [Fructobacillus sp. EFB-N1]KMK53171.1 hypothetical protein FEFB_10990 [Fructobacillus sp. EFB-N1]